MWSQCLLYQLGSFVTDPTLYGPYTWPYSHRYFLPPRADQEIPRGSNSAQTCKVVPRPTEKHWSAWLLVLLVSSKSGVCNTRCHQKNLMSEWLCFTVWGLPWATADDSATHVLHPVSGSPMLWINLWNLRACLLVCHGSSDTFER